MHRKLFALGLLLLMAGAGLPATAQPGAIAGDVIVGSLAGSLASSLRTIVDDVEDAYSSSAFVTREQLQVLIWELETMGSGVATTVFRELNDTQRKFFQNTQNLVEGWNAGNREVLQQVSGLVAQANDALGTLPFAHRKPRVTGFSPHFVDSRRDRAVIRVSGSWLGADSPTLRLGEADCERSGKIETELAFTCPLGFGAPAQALETSGELTVYERQGFWESIVSFFGDAPTRTYEIPLTVMPAVAGTYAARFVTEKVERQTQSRRQRFEHRNDHCEGTKRKTWNFSATSGWRIDPNSVKVEHDSNRESSWQGVDNLTGAGFQAKARVRNQGDCGPGGYPRDGRGKVWGTATWSEYREVKRPEEVEGPSGKLTWGDDAEILPPPEARSYAVTVQLADGSRRILTGAEPHRWLRLIDESPSRLVLRVKDLATALH